MRFFMVPGMGHGPGTAGPLNFNFDALSLIEQWREKGQAPDQLVVAQFRDGKEVGTRLVCQYPRVPTYKGAGSPNDARASSVGLSKDRGLRSPGYGPQARCAELHLSISPGTGASRRLKAGSSSPPIRTLYG